MDPIIAGIGMALGALGQGLGFMESRKARKQAKKDKKEQKIEDAWKNLMNAAAGHGPTPVQQINPLPDDGLGQAVGNIGNIGMQGAQMMSDQQIAAQKAGAAADAHRLDALGAAVRTMDPKMSQGGLVNDPARQAQWNILSQRYMKELGLGQQPSASFGGDPAWGGHFTWQ